MNDPPTGGETTDGETPFGEDFEHIEDLEHLAEQEGLDGLKVAAELLEDELKAKSPLRRLLEFAFAIGITILIFARLIPQFFDVEYRNVWSLLAGVDKPMLAFMFLFWFFTMWCYGGVLAASLPGLHRMQGVVVNFSGSALANVVPFGGAAGVGGTYAQCLSWGFDVPSITLSIIVTGVWNVFAKLGMPIIVLGLLFVLGRSSQGLGAAALVGFAVLVASVVVFALLFRSEALARSIGRAAERTSNVLRRLVRRPPREGLTAKTLEFRGRTIGLVRRRWRPITIWMVLYKVSQALLQLMCARAVGIEIGWLEIFAVYTFGELLSTIPITPSGVGFVEVGATGLLVSFGASTDAALAAVLLYRAFTYLFEIPLGAVGWLTWATKHSWRRPPNSVPRIVA